MMDGTYESLDGISKFHAMHGTTSFLATTDSSTNDRITRALKCVAESILKGVSGAEIIGVHLEGPFLNLKRCGAQNKSEIRLPSPAEIHGFWDASQGLIKLVTLAPEITGGLDAVKQFIGYGTTVSIGHSDATYDEVIQAIQFGVSHTTHHFNGMSPLHHREPGVAGAGLMLPQLTTELIADGIHVHPALVKHLFDSKMPNNICLITDAVQCAGLSDGNYGQVTMTNGQIYLKDGSSLAGSSLTMLQALKNVMQFTGYTLEWILPSLTEVPARQIGMAHRKGSLQTGKDADFLVLDDALNLYSTYVKGKEVYCNK
jgi:N-acetylglucosamine-6-phosphate deacetylase